MIHSRIPNLSSKKHSTLGVQIHSTKFISSNSIPVECKNIPHVSLKIDSTELRTQLDSFRKSWVFFPYEIIFRFFYLKNLIFSLLLQFPQVVARISHECTVSRSRKRQRYRAEWTRTLRTWNSVGPSTTRRRASTSLRTTSRARAPCPLFPTPPSRNWTTARYFAGPRTLSAHNKCPAFSTLSLQVRLQQLSYPWEVSRINERRRRFDGLFPGNCYDFPGGNLRDFIDEFMLLLSITKCYSAKNEDRASKVYNF